MDIIVSSLRVETYPDDCDAMFLLVLKLKRLKVEVKGWEKEHISKSKKLLADIDKEILALFTSCPSGIFTADGSLRLLSQTLRGGHLTRGSSLLEAQKTDQLD